MHEALIKVKEYLFVGFGGMLGSIARYMGSSYFLHAFPNAKFPWGTFFVNIVGCVLIGIVAGLTERLTYYNSEIRLAVITGLIGGFTTFSAFGLETFQLLKDGAIITAFIYAFCSIALGVVCVYLGLRVAI